MNYPSDECVAQVAAAQALLGKLVIFRHNAGHKDLNPPTRVIGVDRDGLVILSGLVGHFAPHLFTVVEEEHYA